MQGDRREFLQFTSLVGALAATGLLGALHCLGMCSGIAGGLLVRLGSGGPIRAVLSFHAARILMYTLLGIAGSTVLMAILFTPFEDPSRVYYGTDTRAAGLLVGEDAGHQALAATLEGEGHAGRLSRRTCRGPARG